MTDFSRVSSLALFNEYCQQTGLDSATMLKAARLPTRQPYRLMGGPNEFSTEKCERLLGYKPVFSFEQAIQELADEFERSSQPSKKSLKS
ncbi:MAG: nucleoside-diphosphate-sugar epimerase [Marinobacter maritimus]|jgi:nucleoside-diphosphate-sugar epimerase|nr:hypothetical protein [Oceanospirillales bacterium]